jgi:hypothetical protein
VKQWSPLVLIIPALCRRYGMPPRGLVALTVAAVAVVVLLVASRLDPVGETPRPSEVAETSVPVPPPVTAGNRHTDMPAEDAAKLGIGAPIPSSSDICWQAETSAGLAQGCERTEVTPEARPPYIAPEIEGPPEVPAAPVVHAQGAALVMSSTAFCETSRMANGQPAYDGAVSSKVLPRGSSWRVLDGPMTGRVFLVADTGSLALFDISLPGRCAEAIAYGRRAIRIEEVR